MKVLMFGWEFPPHISGGLGTACYGITKALTEYPDIDLTFVVPKAYGNEPVENMQLIGANQIDLIESKIKTERFKAPYTCISVQSGLVPYTDPEDYQKWLESEKEIAFPGKVEKLKSIKFTGKYNPDLMTEIHNFSVVAEHIAKQKNYDIIHAHDWLTFPAGILAKKISGKPLIVHVHATDFDRSGGNANPDVFKIEKAGMDAADGIITVSNHTRSIVQKKYSIDPKKIITVHNGVEAFLHNKKLQNISFRKNKVVTFLGRITVQKGPQYFVEVAQIVLSRMKNVTFVMAGSGDMLKEMMELVNRLKIDDHFSFPGFLKGDKVRQMFYQSDVFIMPSVSEPFGICPLEAMFCNVPVIISNQSGVSEVVEHALKMNYWDTEAMADGVYSILNRPVLKKMLIRNGNEEVQKICWKNSATKIINVYEQFVRA